MKKYIVLAIILATSLIGYKAFATTADTSDIVSTPSPLDATGSILPASIVDVSDNSDIAGIISDVVPTLIDTTGSALPASIVDVSDTTDDYAGSTVAVEPPEIVPPVLPNVIPTSSGSHGGGYIRPIVTNPIVTSTPIGQVLGAEKFKFNNNMKFGSKLDPDVKELQNRLMTEGFFKVTANGYFGPATKAALKAYQKANPPLKIDGAVGPVTRALLNK